MRGSVSPKGVQAILREQAIFLQALRVSIAETLSTVSKAKARSATLWGRVERLRAFVFIGKDIG